MKSFSHFCIVFCCLILLVGCAKKKEHIEEKSEVEFESDVMVGKEKSDVRLGKGTVYETVGDNESLQLLVYALRTTGLDSQLMQEGPYTLFAPSDQAFEKMRIFSENKLPDSIDQEELKKILKHHVVKGSYSAADLTNVKGLPTLEGDSLNFTTLENQVTVDSAQVIFADRQADNGYVHVIDEVLLPENQASN